jgi:anhydro-N-acetylmuramic acid kinase
MDFWIDKHQQKKYDEGGVWASSGTVHNELLQLCRNEPFFSKALPKSTGRELFNGTWLENKLAQCQGAIQPRDVQATLLQLTVDTIADALDQHCRSLFVCGGGAHKPCADARAGAGTTKLHSCQHLDARCRPRLGGGHRLCLDCEGNLRRSTN